MSWITVDTGLIDHPKMAALSSDAARWGWMATLLRAKTQRTPGQFASPIHYRHVLGRQAKYLSEYTQVGLLDEVDGHLEVHDWPEYQRDRTASERQQRHRDKSVTVTDESRSDNTPRARPRAVAVAVDVVSSTEGVVKGEPDAFAAFHQRTGQVPGTKLASWLNELTEKHGEQRVVDMIANTPMDGTAPDYLRAIQDRLRLEDYAADRAEKRDEERRNAEKRKPVVVESAQDISDEEAKRLALEYTEKARRSA